MTGRATPWGIRARGQRRIRHARAPLSRPSSRSAPSPDHRHHRTDGSYLAEFLPEKGYHVVGMVRRASTESFERIEGDWTCPGFVDTWVKLPPLPVRAAAR